MTVPVPTREFEAKIVCDDIRQEVGGKHSVMGVFGGDILVASFPATIQLAFFFVVKTPPGRELRAFGLRLLSDDEQLVAMEGQSTTADESSPTTTIVIPKGMVTTDKPCKLRLLMSFDGAPEQEVVTKEIKLFSPSANGAGLPSEQSPPAAPAS